jgi:hypothetical protein
MVSPTMALAVTLRAESDAVVHVQTECGVFGKGFDVMSVQRAANLSTVLTRQVVSRVHRCAPVGISEAVAVFVEGLTLRLPVAFRRAIRPLTLPQASGGDVVHRAADGTRAVAPATLATTRTGGRAIHGGGPRQTIRPRQEVRSAGRTRRSNRGTVRACRHAATGMVARHAAIRFVGRDIRRAAIKIVAALGARQAYFGRILTGHLLTSLAEVGGAVPRAVRSSASALCCPNYTIGGA